MWSISRPGVQMRMSTLLVLPLLRRIQSADIAQCRMLQAKRTFSTLRPSQAELARVRKSAGR